MEYVIEVDSKIANYLIKKFYNDSRFKRIKINTYNANKKEKVFVGTVNKFSSMIEWNDKYFCEGYITLGIDENGNIFKFKYTCNNNSHMVIAGMTGTGKSCIMRNIIYQCILNHNELILIDFKGGLELCEFAEFSKHKVFDNKEEVLELLIKMKELHNQRLVEMRTVKAKNIESYYKKTGIAIPQIIIAIDELAELTDLNGLDKTQKELTNNIINNLASLARTGRVTGFNIISATQYPTVDVLNSQIKRNMIRFSGIVDGDTMSRTILDGTCEKNLAIKEKGRVICKIDTEYSLVQTFYLDENILEEKLNKLIKCNKIE